MKSYEKISALFLYYELSNSNAKYIWLIRSKFKIFQSPCLWKCLVPTYAMKWFFLICATKEHDFFMIWRQLLQTWTSTGGPWLSPALWTHGGCCQSVTVSSLSQIQVYHSTRGTISCCTVAYTYASRGCLLHMPHSLFRVFSNSNCTRSPECTGRPPQTNAPMQRGTNVTEMWIYSATCEAGSFFIHCFSIKM